MIATSTHNRRNSQYSIVERQSIAAWEREYERCLLAGITRLEHGGDADVDADAMLAAFRKPLTVGVKESAGVDTCMADVAWLAEL